MQWIVRFRGIMILSVAAAPALWAQPIQAASVTLPTRPAYEHDGRGLLQRPARLDVATVSVATALTALAESSGVNIAFSPSILPADLQVSCLCTAVTVGGALHQLLAGTRFGYSEVEDYVIVEPERALEATEPLSTTPNVKAHGPMSVSVVMSAALEDEPSYTATISGVVRDAMSQRAIVGAQVFVGATTIGAITDESGRYVIRNAPVGTIVVHVRMLGYLATRQTVTAADGGTTTVNFSLTQQVRSLDQVVVTGTVGQVSRKEIGNSIASVRAEELKTQPIANTQDVLAGHVPGVVIMQNSGVAGAGGSIRIRGMNSITQGNRPLIYIDGVRVYSQAYPGTAQGESSSPLNDIDPNDIDHVEVIKGAAATTLYGTEASNGVVQIFTKRGLTGGSPRWEAKLTEGVDAEPEIGPPESSAFIDKYGSGAKGLFMDQWLRKGRNQDYSASVNSSSGGAKPVSYFLSGGYTNDQGVLPDQFSKGYNARGNLGFTPTSKMVVNFNSAYTTRDIRWLPGGYNANSFTLNVMRGPFDYVKNADSVFLTQFQVVENQNHFTTGADILLTPTTNWSAKAVVGLDYVDSDYGSTVDFGSLLVPQGSREDRRFRNLNRQLDLQSTYKANFWNLSAATSAGFQLFDAELLTVDGNVSNFSGPGTPTLSSGSQQNVAESRLSVINAGFFFQELLGISDRLFLTGGARVDGNSAFGKNYGLQVYPKISASYVISDNGFWPQILGQTKLRLAYGVSGKQPGFFDAQKTWNPISAEGGQPGVTPLNRGNPNLGPERSTEIEEGIESNPFDGRLSIDFSVFHQRTDDALLAVPQDPSTGYLVAQIENAGTIKNHGIELALNATILRRGGFEWDAGVNASATKSIMANLGSSPAIFVGEALAPGLWVKQGYAVPGYWGPKLTNPDQKAAPIVQDAYFGPVYPTRTYSFNSSVKLGQSLTLTGQMDFQGGAYNMSHTAWRNAQRSVWPPCYDIAAKVAAGQVSDLTAEQRYTCDPKEVSYGAYISKTDFWRLRSLGINYALPKRLTGGNQFTVMLGGRNLWTHTNYIGLDPEISEHGDAFTRFEYYQVPVPRSFTFSVRNSF